LTIENCPSQTAFITREKLEKQFNLKTPMFLYKYDDKYVGYFSLNKNIGYVELNNLAVLPQYRHKGIGAQLINYAKDYSKEKLNSNKIQIGIIEDNVVLKEWYKSLGFVHIGTQKFKHLPFVVGFMELNF
jgi:ribosomal protein S18 acetylase RimI-like enzyme